MNEEAIKLLERIAKNTDHKKVSRLSYLVTNRVLTLCLILKSN